MFATIAQEVLDDDPDFEGVRFEILDFCIPTGSEQRTISVIDAATIPRLSNSRKTEMLEIFADGYVQAKKQLASEPRKADKPKDRRDERPDDGLQPDFFT